MTALRRHILSHARLAALMVALALAMRLVVPAGFMPVFAGAKVSLAICGGTGPVRAVAIPHAMAGMHHVPAPDHAPMKAEAPCAFAGLAMPSLAGVDAVLLVAAIGFVLMLGRRPMIAPTLRVPAQLRPPPRGPPALA